MFCLVSSHRRLARVPEEVSLQEGGGGRIDTDAVEGEDREALRSQVRVHIFAISEGALQKTGFPYGSVQKV